MMGRNGVPRVCAANACNSFASTGRPSGQQRFMIAVPNEWFCATSADIALGPSSSMLFTITFEEPASVRHTVPLSATRSGMVRNVRFSYENNAYGLGGAAPNCSASQTAAAFCF
jgi:hypothetical protein